MQKKGFYKTKKFLKTACLATGLAMASWGGGSSAEAAPALDHQLSGTIDPTNDLSHVYVFYSLNTSGSAGWVSYDSVGDVAAGSNTPFSLPIPDPSWYDGDTYTVFGLYDSGDAGSDPDGVTVGMKTGEAAYWIGQDWVDLFPYTDEADIMSYLQNGDTDELLGFFEGYFVDYLGAASGNTLTLVNYTEGTAGGTAYAEVSQVPLPSTLLLLAPGLGVIVLKRRRRK